MIVNHTNDKAIINRILKNDDVWSRVAEEGVTKDEYDAPDGPYYVVDDTWQALLIGHWKNDVTIEVHINVIPEFRHKAREFADLAVKWFWDNTRCQKLVAEIPEIFPDVVKFAKKSGFKPEGVNSLSYRRNGVLYDQFYLGLIRPRGE